MKMVRNDTRGNRTIRRGDTVKRKTFSIIATTYNCGRKLEGTIESVLSQKRDSFEFIVVDGGSTDGTLDLIKHYERELVATSERDRGIYDAFNKGIGMASGRYLYFVGAGDRLREGVLEEVESMLPEDDRTFLYGSAYLARHGVVRFEREHNASILKHWNICHQAIFYGREIFEVVGRYSLDYKVFGDWEMNMRCFGEKRITKRYIPIVVADYEGGGISDTQIDFDFEKDFPALVRKHLGARQYVAHWTDPLRIRLCTQRLKMKASIRSVFNSVVPPDAEKEHRFDAATEVSKFRV